MIQKTQIAGNGVAGSNHYRVFESLYDKTLFEYVNKGTFPDLFNALIDGEVSEIIVATENSIIGPVVEVKDILKRLDKSHIMLKQVHEYSIEIYHALIGGSGATMQTVSKVYSYTAALDQCRKTIAELGLEPCYHEDTWGAAVDVIARNDPTESAIAPVEAALKLGGVVLKGDMSDVLPNKTIFKVYRLDN